MAAQDTPPYIPQDPQQTAALVSNLEAGIIKGKQQGNKKKNVSCKKTTFKIEGTQDVHIHSWRFQDWDYKRDDLPTYARGLFIYRRRDGTPEIATRGYDKFFNVGEVNDTQWRNVEIATKGPYELSVKENGCIIFISGLEDDFLLVCSKHSTGARADADLSHAVAGEKWVDKHLSAIGRTRRDLARELRKRNITLVAELCDDSFEEHVLAYDEKTAGLYVHGINLNLPEFVTYPGHQVHKFADQWGFKKAQYLMKDDVAAMKNFLDGCAETGSHDGRDTEGFVIRCQKQLGGSSGPFVDWFFKYKFDEPYLMYRQWREATKATISGKAPRYKKHKQITDEYLLYARRRLAQNPQLGKAYNANHGIIEMRDGFLKERGLKGSDIIRQENAADGGETNDVTNNVILVPLATLGCGKTTVAIALTKLFEWGHIQNDNITGKAGRPKQFAVQITNALAIMPVVIADRNNHQKRERKQIIEDIERVAPGARFVALHYVHDPKPQMLPKIRQITQRRVFERGNNHQTIQAGSKSREEITSIMEGFLQRFEPLDTGSDPDNLFDEVIHLSVTDSSRDNLEIILNHLHAAYPKLVVEVPSAEDLDTAIAAAMHDYQPDLKHDLSFQSKNKNKGPKPNHYGSHGMGDLSLQLKPLKLEYFCLKLPTSQVLSALSSTFQSQDIQISKFYNQLQQSRRIQPSFHVTLLHRASINQRPELWKTLTSLHSYAEQQQNTSDPLLGKCRVHLERVLWDNRVMCIAARILDEGWETTNANAHVTIGTADKSIKPFESSALLERWLQVGANTESGIGELLVQGGEAVLCEARAVMQGR
ncbi:hypothetical protein MMC14_008113 [Varicellaria rhodocarpa]|nr:hypothetical protein [Varicellaria rhodocarpa]